MAYLARQTPRPLRGAPDAPGPGTPAPPSLRPRLLSLPASFSSARCRFPRRGRPRCKRAALAHPGRAPLARGGASPAAARITPKRRWSRRGRAEVAGLTAMRETPQIRLSQSPPCAPGSPLPHQSVSGLGGRMAGHQVRAAAGATVRPAAGRAARRAGRGGDRRGTVPAPASGRSRPGASPSRARR